MDDIGWCELATEVPGVNVGLSQVENPEGRGGATPVFGVKDIEGARNQLDDNIRDVVQKRLLA